MRRLPIAAAVLAAFALLLVVLGDGAEVDSDLQLCVPPEVAPGGELPLRATLYTGLLAGEGPKLLAVDVDVELRADGGATLARTQLRAAHGGMVDMEGGLRVPSNYHGKATVVARARVDDHTLQVDAQLRVLERASGQPTTPRLLRATAHLLEWPVQAKASQTPPSALRVRVAGGVCVPEQPCTVLVHVGRPAAAVSLQPTAAVTVRGSATAAATEHVARFDVVVHGPEGELRMQALRDGVTVATRAVRLPVALGAVGVTLEPRVVEASQAAKLTMLGEPGGCVVDLFAIDRTAEARWLRTASLPRCGQGAELPFRDLAAGAYRVQVRRDALSSSTAGVAALWVRAPGEAAAATRSGLVSLVRSAGHVDALVADLIAAPDTYTEDDQGSVVRYLLAAIEGDLVVYPPMVTGYAQSLFRQSEELAEVRSLALVALLLSGLGLAAFVGRRGLRASERASAIMLDAGQDPETSERSHLRSISLVIASVLALLLVFVVVALYVMARGSFR